jgi:hypothetical protein
VNYRSVCDDRLVAHLMNLLSASVLVYATVTRGGMMFARVLERFANR